MTWFIKIYEFRQLVYLYSRLFHIIGDPINDITTHISLLLYEFSLESSDLYRISPNTLSSFERWNSSAQLEIFDSLWLYFFWSDVLETYAKTSRDVSAAYGNDIAALLRNAVDN